MLTFGDEMTDQNMTKPVKTLHDIEVKIIFKASLYSAIRNL